MIEILNPQMLKESIDTAIMSIGLAAKAQDIESAYDTIITSYTKIRRLESEGEVQFTMNEKDFISNLQHMTNYNLVRVANLFYEAAVAHTLDKGVCRSEIISCWNALKNAEDYPTEKSLIYELNTLLNDAPVYNSVSYN